MRIIIINAHIIASFIHFFLLLSIPTVLGRRGIIIVISVSMMVVVVVVVMMMVPSSSSSSSTTTTGTFAEVRAARDGVRQLVRF